MTNALLGMASMINDSHEDFSVSTDCLDVVQRLCRGTFETELCIRVLCSNVCWGDLLGFSCCGSEMPLAF